jgi:hypothetical protein
MLRPDLKQVAFASTPASGDAGLDVISGLTLPSYAQEPPSHVLFPGTGELTDLNSYGGELPDPLKTCHWTGLSPGLPLIALLTSPPARNIVATLNGPHGTESSSNGTLCIVDENDYVSPTTVYGPTGSELLTETRAVLVIPHTRLPDGRFVATIDQAGKAPITWSFSERAQLAAPVAGMAPSSGGEGYWLTDAAGYVSPHGHAGAYSTVGGRAPEESIQGIAAAPDGKGYWLVGADGAVHAFWDAHPYGSD